MSENEFANHVAKYWAADALGDQYAERLVFAPKEGGEHFKIDAIAIGNTIVVNGDLGAMVFWYSHPRNLRTFSKFGVEYALEKTRTLDRRPPTKLAKERMALILMGMRLAFELIDSGRFDGKAVAEK